MNPCCILESPYAAPKALRDALAEARADHSGSGTAMRANKLAELAVQAAEAKHLRYLKALARHAFELGFAPFASHALYTQWLDDHDPAERKLGMEAGFAIADALDYNALRRGHSEAGGTLVVLVGMDLGLSSGMECGVKLHRQRGRDVREVYLGMDWGRKTPRLGASARRSGGAL